MEERIVDLTLGIKSISTSVLHLLNNYTMSQFGSYHKDKCWYENNRGQAIEIKTYPWYNGREAGYVLEMKIGDIDNALYIAFAENRSSDDIMIENWEHVPSFNPVCTSNIRTQILKQDKLDIIYAERVCKPNVDSAVDHVLYLMDKYNKHQMLLHDVSNVIQT